MSFYPFLYFTSEVHAGGEQTNSRERDNAENPLPALLARCEMVQDDREEMLAKCVFKYFHGVGSSFGGSTTEGGSANTCPEGSALSSVREGRGTALEIQ
jgi:hypothetical protein